jgi:hypothetical protein
MQRQAVGVISGGFCVWASFVAKDGRVDTNQLKLNSGETNDLARVDKWCASDALPLPAMRLARSLDRSSQNHETNIRYGNP